MFNKMTHLSGRWLGQKVCTILLTLLIVMPGCFKIQLVEKYDPAIDKGLITYYKNTDKFLTKVSKAAKENNEKATYKNNRNYYSEARTDLSALVIRAKAGATSDQCIGTDIVRGLLERLLKYETMKKDFSEIGELLEKMQRELSGSCTVQVLTMVRANHDIMEAIHKHNDKLTPAMVKILKPTIEQGIQIALKIELAKKRGEE